MREILNQKKGLGFKTSEQKQEEKIGKNGDWKIIGLI